MDPLNIPLMLGAGGAERARELISAAMAGGQIMLALAPADVSVSEEMATYLPRYVPFGGFRADEISPVVLVDKDVGTYRVFGLANAFRLIHTETSYLAPVPTIDPEMSIANYRVIPHALGGVIPPRTAAQANFDLRAEVGRIIATKLALRREYKVITFARTLNNWATGQRKTLTSDVRWSGGDNANPVVDLQDAMYASQQPITDIYMGLKSAQLLLRHATTRDYARFAWGNQSALDQAISRVNGNGGTENMDFQLPGLPPIHVAAARALNETTGALEEIIGPDVIMTSNPPGAVTGEGIRTFMTLRTQGGAGTGWLTREWRDEAAGLEGADRIVAGYAEADVMPSNTAGYLLKGVWA